MEQAGGQPQHRGGAAAGEPEQARLFRRARLGCVQKLLAAADATGITLYQANLRTYQLLRYGVPVQIAAGQNHESVHLVDWEHPEKNNFALAEEVTLKGGYQRRPDLVLYLNGLAIGVIELKRGSVEVADGVRQLCTNQEEIFNMGFFSTVQLVFAGNDSQGLRYGTPTSKEQFFVEWKAAQPVDATPLAAGALLDRPLAEICGKTRILDLIRNFTIFDGGIKKVPRPHQFDGVKETQEAHPPKRGRRDLAHPGQRQEHPDGAPGQVDPGARSGNLDSLSLTELIIDTGIHDAIAKKLNQKGNVSRNTIAEGIINNVRKAIIRVQLPDPKFYSQMSKAAR